MENALMIAVERFEELLEKETRIKILASFIKDEEYIRKDDVFRLLGLKEVEKDV